MIHFKKYHPDHAASLSGHLQPLQRQLAEFCRRDDYARLLAEGGFSETAFQARPGWRGGDRVLAIAGIRPETPARGVAWALLSDDMPAGALLPITRRIRAALVSALSTFERIEAVVDPGWPEAVLWARRLGLTPESRIECYWPGRRDAVLFKMIAPPKEQAAKMLAEGVAA